jgi:soluble lytic murein transglycosylase
VTGLRLSVLFAATALLAGACFAAPALGPIPVPQSRPVIKASKRVEATRRKSVRPVRSARRNLNRSDQTVRTMLRVPPLPMPRPRLSEMGPAPLPATFRAFAPPARPRPPLAFATAAMPSPLDLSAVKQAIELVRKGRADEATDIERTISDPVSRKLVEWLILRSDDVTVDFSRYRAFIAANPSWPALLTLRRHAEAALWEQNVNPQVTIDFFARNKPLSAKGYFALARAWLIRGDAARAQAAVRAAWRDTGFSEQVEAQARSMFGRLITPADDKARMEARLYLGDVDEAMRAASHLDAADRAIARARAAVDRNASNAWVLLDAVPSAAQHDPGYMFSRIQWLRRHDHFREATQWMLAAPRDPAKLIDPDQWWVERRLIARKLLDLGDDRTAYEIAANGPPSQNDNHRAEQQFTAGWIALEFLHEPALALPHFARIADGEVDPITLSRSYYWQGRAEQAMGRAQQARAAFETAARYPTAYYGQLARAHLHLDGDRMLRDPPSPPVARRPRELGRVFEILYAIHEPDLVAGMAADIAEKTTDIRGLAALAQIAVRHDDARTTLLIGKIALGRGYPFVRYAFPDFGVPNFRQIGPQVERCVVYAIVRQESAFNSRVVSSAHALGLMQVTPAAGRNTARRFRVPFNAHRLLVDVAYNAQLGTAELGDDINTFRGSYILAFVAYNAGPRRAEQWIQQYGDPRDPRVDPIDWIERIPITETRYYVQRVIENMQVYRARLENNPKLLIEADMRRGG